MWSGPPQWDWARVQKPWWQHGQTGMQSAQVDAITLSSCTLPARGDKLLSLSLHAKKTEDVSDEHSGKVSF